jgi:peptide/nickel transport system ATP-binding protein
VSAVDTSGGGSRADGDQTARTGLGAALLIEDLCVTIHGRRRSVMPIDGISLSLHEGETLGLVGESGCGKSMTALAILGLLPGGGTITSGRIWVCGQEITGLPERARRCVRGEHIGIVFQDPMTSLNPSMTIGAQIVEPLRLYRSVTKAQATERAIEVLSLVGLPSPRSQLDNYPHQLSGGMRQRAMIAMALVCEPRLLIADEPTTALDVTIQAQILALLDDLRERLGMALLLITHDMGVIAQHTDRVAVMYAGRIVETAETTELFARTRHPYTHGLLASIPTLDQDRTKRLPSIPGAPPDLSAPPPGCRFAPRCPRVSDLCRSSAPVLGGSIDHSYACHRPLEVSL